MIAFTMDGTTAEKLQGYLGAARIRTRRVAESGYEYLRLSTHIYVLPRDIERVVSLLKNAPSG
jgi:selenocysteine lyase/cysteine desulfurase